MGHFAELLFLNGVTPFSLRANRKAPAPAAEKAARRSRHQHREPGPVAYFWKTVANPSRPVKKLSILLDRSHAKLNTLIRKRIPDCRSHMPRCRVDGRHKAGHDVPKAEFRNQRLTR
jgi:hypothetical protein